MGRYVAPKSVLNNPAVESCTSGEETGGDQKHYVVLKDGYWFGSQDQRTSLFFDHVSRPKVETGRVWTDWASLIERKE